MKTIVVSTQAEADAWMELERDCTTPIRYDIKIKETCAVCNDTGWLSPYRLGGTVCYECIWGRERGL